jgi:hypothetical protein
MDVFELRLHGIAMRFDHDWRLAAMVPHGAFLSHGTSQLTIHLRGWHRCGDAQWLRCELFAQNWIGPPTDIDERTIEDRMIIGGTFRCPEPEHLVREWFITNGRASANAAILFPRDTPTTSLVPFERMLDAVTFVEPA